MAWHRQLLRRALSASCPRRLLVTRGPHGKDICLTFDDGPHPDYTPRVLDVLGRHGVRATFFLIGREAERYPDIVRRIDTEGHDIGHHSYEHRTPALTSARQLAEEIGRTAAVFEGVVGRAGSLVRPPHGKV